MTQLSAANLGQVPSSQTVTNSDFNYMLKKYMPYKMLEDELVKRDYLLSKVAKDNNWKGGQIQVPFMGARASSFKFGGLTHQDQISEDKPVLGVVNDYKELWGSMVFNDSDLSRHGSLEQSFLKIIPDTLEVFLQNMKSIASVNLLNGAHICQIDVAASTDRANGNLVVDKPERLQIGQELTIGVVGTQRAIVGGGASVFYVIAIDMNDSIITLSATRGGAAADLSYTGPAPGPEAGINITAGDKLFVPGAITSGKAFSSLKDQLLSSAAGGLSSHFGLSKTLYPFLQAYNKDGSSATANTLLETIFETMNRTREIGKGNPNEAIMSFSNMSAIMKAIELGFTTGGHTVSSSQVMHKDSKYNAFGWQEIVVSGVKGSLKLVAVPEMDNDVIFILDWNSIKLFSNGMFERRTSPSGNQYYEIRSTDGFKYIVDMRFFGELVVSKPSSNAVIHSLDI